MYVMIDPATRMENYDYDYDYDCNDSSIRHLLGTGSMVYLSTEYYVTNAMQCPYGMGNGKWEIGSPRQQN